MLFRVGLGALVSLIMIGFAECGNPETISASTASKPLASAASAPASMRAASESTGLFVRAESKWNHVLAVARINGKTKEINGLTYHLLAFRVDPGFYFPMDNGYTAFLINGQYAGDASRPVATKDELPTDKLPVLLVAYWVPLEDKGKLEILCGWIYDKHVDAEEAKRRLQAAGHTLLVIPGSEVPVVKAATADELSAAMNKLVSASQPATSQAPASTVSRPERLFDGLYFLSDGEGVRILKISEGKFDLLRIGGYGNFGGMLSGVIFYGAGGSMNARFFNGQRQVDAFSTCALVEGHVWLGALRKTGPKNDSGWTSGSENASFFGSAAEGIPTGSVGFDLQEHVWYYRPYTPSSRSTLPAPIKFSEVEIEDLSPIPSTNPTSATSEPTVFLPIFAQYPEIDRLMESWPRAYAFGRWGTKSYALYPFGIVRGLKTMSPTTRVFWDEPKQKAHDDLVAEIARQPSRMTSTYRRCGDAILAPWSVDLGPLGLTPAKLSPEQIAGKWICEGDIAWQMDVTIEPSSQKAPEFESVRVLAPSTRPAVELTRMESSLAWRPDSFGITVKQYGVDCVMGHFDSPGYIVWIPISPDRAACYVRPATHSALRAGLVYFKREIGLQH